MNTTPLSSAEFRQAMAHINGSERDVSDDEPEDDDGEDAGGGPVESRED